MDINITVPAGLDLFRGQEELLVQFLVQLIEDQAALGGYSAESVLAFSLSPMYMMDWLFL